jgi:hypothetical protein
MFGAMFGRYFSRVVVLVLSVLGAGGAAPAAPATAPAADDPSKYFAIEVVDDATGRGVPLVELETVNNIRYHTDSAGVVAFYEPGLMNQTVFFTVRSHGYAFEKDMFGFAGKQLEVKPGGKAQLKVKRLNIAERLYRVTGAGIYDHTVRLGRAAPIAEPLLNAKVLGQDSVQAAVFGGKIYWFWGDTNQLAYPLGNFATTGATSKLPADGGLDPSVGIDLEYVRDENGFTKKLIVLPEQGPVWTDAVCVIPDDAGREALVGNVIRVKTLGVNLERGIVVWDDAKRAFQKKVDVPVDHPLGPMGQAVTKRVSEGGVEYQLFAQWGPPNIRVPATLSRFLDLSAYEGYTPLAPGERFAGAATKLERDAAGKLVWGWKKNTATLENRQQKQLIDLGLMTADESPQIPRDVDTGRAVQLHSASVQWNEFRKRWVMIALEFDGASKLGEVWYGEAERPEGPWPLVKKIVTHDRYSFYNPRHHVFLDGEGGRYVYFEGTFANSISGTDVPTPKYDYNQVMYRLDLEDSRLQNVQPGRPATRPSGG